MMMTTFSHLHICIAILLAATGVLANPSTPSALVARSGGVSPFNPSDVGGPLSPLEMVMTNAERLSAGLPPNRPHFRRQARAARPRPSAVAAAANPGPTNGECSPRTGVIHVASPNRNDNTRPALDGYVSRTANAFGEYLYTPDRNEALVVTINECDGAPFDVRSTNGFRSFPFVGAIKGFSSDSAELRPNSFNYLYIGGVSQTAPLATPQEGANSFSVATGDEEPSESAIWSFATRGGERVLEAQWVNPDGSLPQTTAVYVPSKNVFALVGDVGGFEGMFDTTASEVTMVFQA